MSSQPFSAKELEKAVSSIGWRCRGVAASMALWRLSVLAESPEADAIVPTVGELIVDSVQFAFDYAREGASLISAEGLKQRFLSMLGTEEDPIDEPPLPDIFLIDLASLADYTVRVWVDPGESAFNAWKVLIAAFNLACSLGDEIESEPESPLSDPEYARQLDDLGWLSEKDGSVDVAMLNSLMASSEPLRGAYARRFSLATIGM
jgi:hypothetical protein